MSDSEKKPENASPSAPSPDDASHPAAEIEELPKYAYFEAPKGKKPSIKDYLKSPDSPSRYLMLTSFVLAALAGVCFVFLFARYLKHRHSEQKIAPAVEIIKIEPTIEEKLGEFRVNWIGDGELRADVVIACANLAVCEALKNRKAEARDRILPILQGSSRAEILNPGKKQMLRQHITDSLNEMHLPGKVIETNFSDMTVDVGH